MGIERRYGSFNVVDAEGNVVDTFFYGGATLWEARHAECGNYPGCTIEAVASTLIPLTESEMQQIASENELHMVKDSDGKFYFISEDIAPHGTMYDALHSALDDMGVDLNTYGEE